MPNYCFTYYYISYNIQSLVVGPIRDGTLILAPCLFIIRSFKFLPSLINLRRLIYTVNGTLLLGSSIASLLFIAEIYNAFFIGGDYVQYTFANAIFGSVWLLFWLNMLCHNLLPQILWIKGFRHSITTSALIIGTWLLLMVLSKAIPVDQTGIRHYFTRTVTWLYYLKEASIYVVILAIVYLTLERKIGPRPINEISADLR